MKEKINKKTTTEASIQENSILSVKKHLQKIFEIRGMSFEVKSFDNTLYIARKPNHLLFILLYLIYFILPVLVIGNRFHELFYLLLLYYPLFFLLVWNTTRKTKSLLFDIDKKVLKIKNNNILGMIIRKPLTIKFDDILKFEATYISNKRKGKTFNQIYLVQPDSKKTFLIEIVAEGASLRNGNKFVELVSSLIEKPNK